MAKGTTIWLVLFLFGNAVVSSHAHPNRPDPFNGKAANHYRCRGPWISSSMKMAMRRHLSQLFMNEYHRSRIEVERYLHKKITFFIHRLDIVSPSIENTISHPCMILVRKTGCEEYGPVVVRHWRKRKLLLFGYATAVCRYQKVSPRGRKMSKGCDTSQRCQF